MFWVALALGSCFPSNRVAIIQRSRSRCCTTRSYTLLTAFRGSFLARLSPLVSPLFTSIDPVIHYQSKTGKRQEFGRTDLGRKGVREFFKTHECNDVCRLLCLPGARSPEVEAAAKAAKAAAKAGRAAEGRGKRPRMSIPWHSCDAAVPVLP